MHFVAKDVTPTKPTKSLQGIPLLLTPDGSFENAATDKALSDWIQQAYQEDKQLGINRDWIPFVPLYIPDTPEGRNFYNLAKAIGEQIQLIVEVENYNQACWLKRMQYYWQARGVLLAYKLFGVIPNPLEAGGILFKHLPTINLEDLQRETELDLTLYRLIQQGESYIKNQAAARGRSYPFNNPTELFLETLCQQFVTHWLLGPLSQEYQWLSKHEQEENFSAGSHLLSQNPWLGGSTQPSKSLFPRPRRLPYPEAQQQYVQHLEKEGWSGFLLLIFREYDCWGSLAPLWQDYLKARKDAKDLFIDQVLWRNRQPYLRGSTCQIRRIEARIDPQGYIYWVWA